MVRKQAILLLLSLTGCGKILPFNDFIDGGDKPYDVATTDPVFYSYLEQLPMTVNTPIYFKDQEDGIAGTCWKWSSGYREIQIDRKYWNSASDSYRLELLAHEIGHCDYNLGHNDNLIVGKCGYESVMYPYNFGGDCFTDNFDYYMREF
jgi:hypothetical protein